MDKKTTGSRVGRRARAPEETMTRRDLAVAMHEKTKGKHTIGEMLEYVQVAIECLAEAMVEGRYIEFRDFGTFEMVERKERLGRNPRQPQDTYVIPNRKVIKFKPARKILQSIEQKDSGGGSSK